MSHRHSGGTQPPHNPPTVEPPSGTKIQQQISTNKEIIRDQIEEGSTLRNKTDDNWNESQIIGIRDICKHGLPPRSFIIKISH